MFGPTFDNPTPIIIGERDDVHVAAVIEQAHKLKVDLAVVDAQALLSNGVHLELGPRSGLRTTGPPVGGWIRRLAPAGWSSGVTPASHDGVVASSWIALLVGWISAADVQWLTSLEQLVRAEGKLLQLRSARALGIRVPETVVSSSAETGRQIHVVRRLRDGTPPSSGANTLAS